MSFFSLKIVSLLNKETREYLGKGWRLAGAGKDVHVSTFCELKHQAKFYNPPTTPSGRKVSQINCGEYVQFAEGMCYSAEGM